MKNLIKYGFKGFHFTILQGRLCPGKLNPSHTTLCIPYGGQEILMQEYEILIQVQHFYGQVLSKQVEEMERQI